MRRLLHWSLQLLLYALLLLCAWKTWEQARAYERVRGIHWDGVYYRTDIGHRAIAREP